MPADDGITFADIVSGALGHAGANVVVVLKVYSDCSGSNAEPVIAAAGFVAGEDVLRAFEPMWCEVVEEFQVQCLGSSDLENMATKGLGGWSRPRLADLHDRYLQVIRESGLYRFAYGCGITRNLYETLNAEFALDEYVGGMYPLTGYGFLSHVYMTFKCLNDINGQARFAVFLEKGDTGQKKLIKTLQREYRERHVGSQVVALEKKVLHPDGIERHLPIFMACDFMAYEIRNAKQIVDSGGTAKDYRYAGIGVWDDIDPRIRWFDRTHIHQLCQQARVPTRASFDAKLRLKTERRAARKTKGHG